MKNLFFTAVFSISVSMLSAQQIESQNLQKVSSTENKLSSLNDQSSASKKLFGNVSYYYENGKLKEIGSFIDGQRHGTWIRYDENGNKLAEGNYNNGLKDGKWMIWDENGNKRFEFSYQNGQKYSIWSSWDEKGSLIASTNYEKE
jgi:antitoxin component YwqK of YwqJK toxin-antitoxin module